MTSYTVRARYLDKFGRQWNKKLWKFGTGAKCTKFLKFMSIIDYLRYMFYLHFNTMVQSHLQLVISGESRLDASSLKTEVGVLQRCKLLKVELQFQLCYC